MDKADVYILKKFSNDFQLDIFHNIENFEIDTNDFYLMNGIALSFFEFIFENKVDLWDKCNNNKNIFVDNTSMKKYITQYLIVSEIFNSYDIEKFSFINLPEELYNKSIKHLKLHFNETFDMIHCFNVGGENRILSKKGLLNILGKLLEIERKFANEHKIRDFK